MAMGATGGASGTASNLGAPGMTFFTAPPNGYITAMRHRFRSERQILLLVPFL